MLAPGRKTTFSGHQNTIGDAPKQWSAATVRVTDVATSQLSAPLSLWAGVAAEAAKPTSYAQAGHGQSLQPLTVPDRPAYGFC